MNGLSPRRTAVLGFGLSLVSAALWCASRWGLRAYVQLVSDAWQLQRPELMANKGQSLKEAVRAALEPDFRIHDIILAPRVFDSPATLGESLTGHADHFIITVDGGSVNPIRRRQQLERLLDRVLAELIGGPFTIVIDPTPPLPK